MQKGNDLKIKTYPKTSYIVAGFPLRDKLSIIFGVVKVYPSIDEFVQEKGYTNDGAVIEIYDVPNKKIHRSVFSYLFIFTISSKLTRPSEVVRFKSVSMHSS